MGSNSILREKVEKLDLPAVYDGKVARTRIIVALRKLCVIELFDSPSLKFCSFSCYWPLFLPIYTFLENSLMIGLRKGSKEH